MFKLLLSAFDEYTTIASINCNTCKVSNKYNSLLSNTSTYIGEAGDVSINLNIYSQIYQDQCTIPSFFIQVEKKIKKNP